MERLKVAKYIVLLLLTLGVEVSRNGVLVGPWEPFLWILIRSDINVVCLIVLLLVLKKWQRRICLEGRCNITFKCCLLYVASSFTIHKGDIIGVLNLVGNLRLTINSFDAGSDEIPSGLRRRDCCYPSPTVASGPRCKDTGHWAPTKIQAVHSKGWKNLP